MLEAVSFNANGGTVAEASRTYVVGAAYGELPVPVRSRYDFDGWYTREGKAGDRITATARRARTFSKESLTDEEDWAPADYEIHHFFRVWIDIR